MRSSQRPQPILITICSGAVSVAGWSPVSVWPLIPLAYLLLLRALTGCHTWRRAAAHGVAFGLAQHIAGHGWLFGALNTHAGLSAAAAAGATLFAAGVLAAPTALACLLWFALSRGPRPAHAVGDLATRHALAFALLMTLAEWTRSLPFNGLTSLSLGYGLIDTWFAGLAPLTGIYGVSLVGYLAAGLCLAALADTSRMRNARIGGLAALLVTCLAAGQIPWTQPHGPALSFSLIQTGVAQQDKFRDDRLQHVLSSLIEQIERSPADIVLTPETAVPTAFDRLAGDPLARLQASGRTHSSHLFLGIATTSPTSEGFNSIVHLDPWSSSLTRYDKTRLMPFGEYTPAGFGWFTRQLRIPLKDLSAGSPHQAPFVVRGRRLGSMICHEDFIGEDARRWLPDTSILLNPSNLAWFDGSLAIDQRLDVVRMRALETGRPVLRAANTGITAHIGPDGTVIDRLPEGIAGELRGDVLPHSGMTPFARWGDYPTVLVSVAGLLLLMFRTTSSRRKAPTH